MDLNYFYKYNIQTINSNISLQIADYIMYILLSKFKKHEINKDNIENIYKLKFLKKIINTKINTLEKLNIIINDINILLKSLSKL